MVRAVSSDALSPLSPTGPLWTLSVTSNPRAKGKGNSHNGRQSRGAASSPEAGKGVQMEIILNSVIPCSPVPHNKSEAIVQPSHCIPVCIGAGTDPEPWETFYFCPL